MKTAEEWWAILMEKNGAATTASEIEAIQLNAMKEGMRRAAHLMDNHADHHVIALRKAILSTAEQLTENDL